MGYKQLRVAVDRQVHTWISTTVLLIDQSSRRDSQNGSVEGDGR